MDISEFKAKLKAELKAELLAEVKADLARQQEWVAQG